MDSFVLFAYVSLAASKTLLQWLLVCLNFTLDSEDLLCWYKRKKLFPWTKADAQTDENHGDEWGLTWYLRWGIYTSIPTWTNLQNSLAVAEALNLGYPPKEHRSNDHKNCHNQHEKSHKLYNEMGHPVLSLTESQWKLRQQHDQNFPMEGKL